MKRLTIIILITCCFGLLKAEEYHVATNGSNYAEGSSAAPFRTIAYAAQIAQAGDTVTVHAGTYRESINPINGGTDPYHRILYRVAPNERVIIKGSEIIKDWQKHEGSVWKVVIPNSFFGNYNPYQDELDGDWLFKEGIVHHTGEVFLNGKSLYEKNNVEDVTTAKPHEKSREVAQSIYTWYAEVDKDNTTIWANFQQFDPNKELVEINVRPYCFYPENSGVNYITVRGFIMDQAATQWAAPTAEQVGLIGTHWSKGWIIENNIISNSKSVGITLGKERSTGHNAWSKNPEKDGATHYNEVIFKAYYIGWSKENIGSHIVRNNTIFRCGQAGIVGSLGAVFSEISHNYIYDIWAKRIFGGYEQAGIKIHAPIDMLIANNRVHNTGRGIWLDWMAQGTRVKNNLLYDNTSEDLFIEVSHGPYLVENNIFLSDLGIRNWAEGGAFVHNLLTGQIEAKKVEDRTTPYHFPHSTKILGVKNIEGGDNYFYNNLFLKQGTKKDSTYQESSNTANRFYGLEGYNITKLANKAGANVYYNGAKPLEGEISPIEQSDLDPLCKLEKKGEELYLSFTVNDALFNTNTTIITTEKLGKTFISEAFFENPDGSPYALDKDFYDKQRDKERPKAGPFEHIKAGENSFKLW